MSDVPDIRKPLTLAEFRVAELKKRAWLEFGLIVLAPGEITDEWLRQGLVNEATKRHGTRREDGRKSIR